MKRLAIIGGLVLAAAGLGLAGVGTAAAAQPGAQGPSANFPDGTYSIALNPFCDIITFVKPGAAGAPGVQGSDDPNCFASNLYGVAAQRGVVFNWEGTGTPSQMLVLNYNGTWTLYYDVTGTGQVGVFNSGTWSFAAPSRKGKGLPSAAVAKGRSFTGGQSAFSGGKTFPGPKSATLNLSFDGYCDGEQLSLPGAAGWPSVQGVQTGCAGFPLVGAGTPYMLALNDYNDFLMYVINADQTFLIYSDCAGDGNECLNLTGTWSYGVAKPGNRHPATATGTR